MRDRWRRLDVIVRDVPLAGALAAVSLLPAAHGVGTMVGGLPHRPFDLLALAAVALQTLPLAIRRRLPILSVALVFVGFFIDQAQGYHSLAGTGLAIAILSSGARLGRRRWIVGALLTGGYVVLVVTLVGLGATETPLDFVTFYLTLVGVWLVGEWWRYTRAIDAERRRLIAERTREAERARIARDMHDVVTHHVTAMVVQAEAAHYITDPERMSASLDGISATGRSAISDLRGLLDLLNPDRAVPTLHALVDQTRRAGQPVHLTESGGAATGGETEYVAYRVVQESLTNALKYAHGADTVVRVERDAKRVALRITTDGMGSSVSSGGSGRGLPGIRDRVAALGGTFEAGPDSAGGFAVSAEIPVHITSRESQLHG
ncbi:two-component sensor histidine kinase [Microbacterium faecale]|uniref:histidine kinase n=2 Tax=Microbacterium faecale TaxID=1804630 RepID=A0A917DFA3_9MICO|nr:two-component sensor histidine kinase [Microbacterium faecale]